MPFINRKHKIKEKPTPYIHHNNVSAQYYNTSQWHKLRDYYIKNHPFCERCAENGKVTLAQQVHHKIEFMNGFTDEDRWRLLLDEDNLQSLCTKCHTDIHNQRNKKKKDNEQNNGQSN